MAGAEDVALATEKAIVAQAGSRVGGPEANLEAFTEVQWVTVQAEPPTYPF